MKYQIGDLIKVPEDKYSPEELVIITKVVPETSHYEIYDIIKGENDSYDQEYLDEAGQKVG
jgi:hypothetical protein